MPKNFDEKARKRLLSADLKARSEVRREHIGTECLLLALLDPESDVHSPLHSCGLEYERVFSLVHHFLGGGKRTYYLTPRMENTAVREIKARAEIRAFDQCHREITTVDLAIALFEFERGIVQQVLDKLSLQPEFLVKRLEYHSKTLPVVDSENVELLLHGFTRLLSEAAQN